MASSIKIACPECEHVHSLRTELLGRRLICVRCNHSFQARIAFPCPSCNYSLPLDLDKLGQQVSCTQCGHDFLAQVRLPCPECSRALKIRAGYIGHRIICKKCARVFRVVFWKERLQLSPVAPERAAPQPAGVQDMVGGDVSQTAQNDKSVSAALEQAARLEQIVKGMEAERDLLRARIEMFEREATDVEELKAALQAREKEVEGLRSDFAEYEARSKRSEQETAQASRREVEATRVEREDLRQEAERLKSQLQAKSLQDERVQRLAEALGEAQAARDRLLGEREEGLRQREQLRSRAEELERSLADTASAMQTAQNNLVQRLEEESGRAETDRQAIQAHWEEKHKRQASEAERQLHDLQARLDSVRQQGQQQTGALERQFQRERDLLRDEVESLRAGADALLRERDAALEQLSAHTQTHEPGPNDQGKTQRETEQRLLGEVAELQLRLKQAQEQEVGRAARIEELSEQLHAQQLKQEGQGRREREQLRVFAALEEDLKLAQSKVAEQKEQQEAAEERFFAECESLRQEIAQFREKNTLLSQEQLRQTLRAKQLEDRRQKLVEQAQALKAELAQQQHEAAVSKQEFDAALKEAATDCERLTRLLAGEQARFQGEKQASQERLSAAVQQSDEERKGLRDDMQKLQHEASALRLERNSLLGQIAGLTQETKTARHDREEFETLHREATVRFQAEVTRLTQAAQQSQQALQALRAECEKLQAHESENRSRLAEAQEERDSARAEATEARNQVAIGQRKSEREREELTEQLECVRRELNAFRQQHEAALLLQQNGDGAALAHTAQNADSSAGPSPQIGRLAELAERIELLELEINLQRPVEREKGLVGRGLEALGRGVRRALGSAPAMPDEAHQEPPGADHHLRALWTEVMSERERVIRNEAEARHADLLRQLEDARQQLQAVTGRTASPGPDASAAQDQVPAEGEV